MSTSAYAIIESGGKQHRVSEGDVIDVELLSQNPGDTHSFEHIIFVNDGKNSHLGAPHLKTFLVEGLIQSEVKGPKITSMKFERRENNRKKWGHRQKYTRVEITNIAEVAKKKKAPTKKAEPTNKEESTKE